MQFIWAYPVHRLIHIEVFPCLFAIRRAAALLSVTWQPHQYVLDETKQGENSLKDNEPSRCCTVHLQDLATGWSDRNHFQLMETNIHRRILNSYSPV